jgi:hypothetical protein
MLHTDVSRSKGLTHGGIRSVQSWESAAYSREVSLVKSGHLPLAMLELRPSSEGFDTYTLSCMALCQSTTLVQNLLIG